jgi:hypothetical protein
MGQQLGKPGRSKKVGDGRDSASDTRRTNPIKTEAGEKALRTH